RLVPEAGELRVEIRGALAAILALGSTNDKTAGGFAGGSIFVLCSQFNLVAGARFERATFRL
ncbi:MAG: hypothetical protein AB7E55_36515, partial [Pigmentiphaga sp.]